jgi:hypothetical protein
MIPRGAPRWLLAGTAVLLLALVSIPVLPGSATPAAPRAAGNVLPAGHPASGACPTPTISPHWGATLFDSAVLVNVSVSGYPGLSGPNFQTVPCTNTLPSNAEGMWVNLSTNVAIRDAVITIWATGWPTPSASLPSPPGFFPAKPATLPLVLSGGADRSAAFYLNAYRYFPPGTTVYFNLSVNASSGSPPEVFSNSSYHEPERLDGVVDWASWKFTVAPAWFSPTFGEDIGLATSPPTNGTGTSFDPNPQQTLQIDLTSLRPPTGGAPPPIGVAELFFNITSGPEAGGPYDELFQPINRTAVNLSTPLGPFPNGSIRFQVVAWGLWAGSRVDPIWSPVESVNWSDRGGWWYPGAGLSANLNIVTSTPLVPNVTATIAVEAPVNVTVHSPRPNVTIAAASLAFRYADAEGHVDGVLPMRSAGPNTSFAELPGLPSGGTLSFSIVARDIYGTSVSSGNYSYTETAAPVNLTPAGTGIAVVEVVDVSTGLLVPSVPVTFANGSWSGSSVGTPFGFASPASPAGGPGPYPLSFGTYHVAVTAFGRTLTGALLLNGTGPTVLVFDVASATVPADVYATPLAFPVAGGIALLAATAMVVLLVPWYGARRRQLEAEKRRVAGT